MNKQNNDLKVPQTEFRDWSIENCGIFPSAEHAAWESEDKNQPVTRMEIHKMIDDGSWALFLFEEDKAGTLVPGPVRSITLGAHSVHIKDAIMAAARLGAHVAGEMDADIVKGLLEWFATGETGLSSEAIARTAAGYTRTDGRYDERTPSDPSDLRRCILLLRAVPQAREKGLEALAERYVLWAELAAVWDELEETLVEEAGDYDLPLSGRKVPRTAALMRAAIERGIARQMENRCD